MNRRSTKFTERIQPCHLCGYPLSERHHMLPVYLFGDTEQTVQLCPNCHQLFHLIYDALVHDSERNANLFKHFRKLNLVPEGQLEKTVTFVWKAMSLHVDYNLIEGKLLKPERLMKVLGIDFYIVPLSRTDIPFSLKSLQEYMPPEDFETLMIYLRKGWII